MPFLNKEKQFILFAISDYQIKKNGQETQPFFRQINEKNRFIAW